MDIETLILGPLETNTYVLHGDGGECWVIDPAGMDGGQLLDYLQRNRLSPTRVLLTHGHGDHIAGVPDLTRAFPTCRVCCPEGDAPMLPDPNLNLSALMGVSILVSSPDESLRFGQVLMFGQIEWTVLDTSGHTVGGASYYSRQMKTVFVGDALFSGSVGRTDIPGGSAGRLLKNIRLNLMSLDDETRVLCGHGPETTIGRERRANPFMKDFYKLKGPQAR